MADTESDSLHAQSDRNMVREIVKSIMILDRSKKPFKYNDIVSNLNPKPIRKKWAQMFNEAKNCLKTAGLIIHEIKHSSNKMYFVTSQTQPLEIMYKYAAEEEISDRILLTFVLTYVFMKNGAVPSDRLFNHLQSLGIYNESKASHPYFGNVKKKVLTEFSEQLYLSLVKVAVDPDVFEVKWGQRAELEVSKRSILEFICKQGFGGKVRPQEHTSHYGQVLIQEGGGKATDAAGNRKEMKDVMAEVMRELLGEEIDFSDSDSDIQDINP